MPNAISISIPEQQLNLLDSEGSIIHYYPISSASNGTGFVEDSLCTPTGNFTIDEKHGYKAPIYTQFKSRQPCGKWGGEASTSDLILSRILWLKGVDPENANTKQRYIYIHGTNHEESIGSPQSCGCIRMKNSDVIELYASVSIGTKVTIHDFSPA